MLFCLVAARQQVVRFLPQMASLYASIGMPVNLRGLAFENIKTLREMQDGVPMLIIEGEIVGTTARHTEVPRLRFAVIDGSGKEIYAWTARPSRSLLPPGETLPFRCAARIAARRRERHIGPLLQPARCTKPDLCEGSWREYCLQKTKTHCANWSRAR